MVTEKGPKHAQNQFLTQFLENTLNLPNIFMVLVSQVQKHFKKLPRNQVLGMNRALFDLLGPDSCPKLVS